MFYLAVDIESESVVHLFKLSASCPFSPDKTPAIPTNKVIDFDTHLRGRILNRVNNGADVNEVWLRNADESLTMLFRKTEGQP